MLCALLCLWLGAGSWIALRAPFGSGTDESTDYVAFAAAKNRWATEADFRRYGVEHFYYPPLYFLLFAPLWGDEPSFAEAYPTLTPADVDQNYLKLAGRRVLDAGYLARVPAPLVQLYRQAKFVSLACGVVALLCLVGTVRLLFPDPGGWWVALIAAGPAALLPQFLYYQTLVNNDALLNALAAGATASFTAGVVALERGGKRAFWAAAVAMAACLGLALLTKTSALVLLPFGPGLLWARVAADHGLAGEVRARRALHLAALLTLVVVACGGWWTGYMALQGDWDGAAAQRLAHPWAVVDASTHPAPLWWVEPLVQVLRTYYGLFAGALYINVPDLVFLGWMAIPAAVAACAAAVAVAALRRRRTGGTQRPPRSLRPIVWTVLGAVVATNVAGLVFYLRSFMAAYGRLLFPSLVASHVLAAAVVARALRRRPRALSAAALLLVAYAGALFAWTFQERLAAAVVQPAEDVRILTGSGTDRRIGPLWDFSVEQAQTIPPGELAAVRVALWRDSLWPQIGGRLDGSLLVRSATGATEELPLRGLALGDADLARSWVQLDLVRPVGLRGPTAALLRLRGTAPVLSFGNGEFGYVCADGGLPLRWNGEASPCALCVAAVYRPPCR